MAKKNHFCSTCNSTISKNEYALSQKLFGNKDIVLCLKCMALQFNVTVEDLENKIEEYKNEGCTLFK